MAAGVCHISHLDPEEQNRKLEMYNEKIKPVVRQFLAHFSGHMTFHLRQEMVVSQGAPTTVLHRHLTSLGYNIRHYRPQGYRSTDAMVALSSKEIIGIAETALSNFEEVKGPLELRVAIMKSIGLHPKDLAGATVYLETAADPIPYPSTQDLEDWIGWDPDVRDSLKEMKEDSLQNRIIIERMGVTVAAWMKMEKSLTDAEALCTKADNLQQESKGTETDDIVDNQEQSKTDI